MGALEQPDNLRLAPVAEGEAARLAASGAAALAAHAASDCELHTLIVR